MQRERRRQRQEGEIVGVQRVERDAAADHRYAEQRRAERDRRSLGRRARCRRVPRWPTPRTRAGRALARQAPSTARGMARSRPAAQQRRSAASTTGTAGRSRRSSRAGREIGRPPAAIRCSCRISGGSDHWPSANGNAIRPRAFGMPGNASTRTARSPGAQGRRSQGREGRLRRRCRSSAVQCRSQKTPSSGVGRGPATPRGRPGPRAHGCGWPAANEAALAKGAKRWSRLCSR